jgi:CrcB protein
MIQILAIAAGGAIGAVLRYWASNGVYALLGREFPYGTMAVNILGSLLMGFLFVMLVDRMDVSAAWRAIFLIGFLGAFTTFSTFSIETLNLIEDGALLSAGLNMILSVALCVLAAWIGVNIGRNI